MLIPSSIYHNWAHLNDTQRPSFLKAFLSSWMPVKIPALCDSPLTAGPAVSPFSTSSSCPLTSSPSTPPYSHLITDLPLHHSCHHPISSPSSHLITTLPSHHHPHISSPSSPPPPHSLSTTTCSPLALLTPWTPLLPPQASFFSAVQLSPPKPINNSLLIKVQSGK